ncbi:hypothetical protein MKO06_02735 [Gramella sp. GC03-9]|uniref:Uncharacterized protein n=1 Tax=Christiangramia oceanisediminis TaxID=2920386 RepID=A0A9X2I2T6_9FLAO|nr:hypothetical protein [Gramella oceanisediminis]MCP9198805.1 hypothetical protein [Gramella oceanisediminis]
MKESNIQLYHECIEPRFELIVEEKDKNGLPNSIYWKENLKNFKKYFKYDTDSYFENLDYSPHDFFWTVNNIAAKIFKLHYYVFVFQRNKEEYLITPIGNKHQEVIDKLDSLSRLHMDIRNIEDLNLANKIKVFFIKWIHELQEFIKAELFIQIDKGPLFSKFQDIIQKFKNAIDIHDISIKAELGRLNKNNILEEKPIDLSDSSRNEKIICLHELGLIDAIRNKSPFGISTNQLASIISLITGVKSGTIQSYINPIVNPSVIQKNNPLKNENEVKKLRMKLNKLGIETNSTE